MAIFGLGEYKYDVTVDNGSKFHFYDPEDADNTADVTVAKGDYPDGVTDGDARQIADIAYGLVAKQLNDKRDARLRKEAAEQLDKQLTDQQTARESANEFLASAKDISESDTLNHSEEQPQENGKKK